MRSTYRVLAGLIALGVVLQAAFIALAWFTVINEVDGGFILDENYDGNAGHALHGIVGTAVIPALALVLLILSFFAKIQGGIKWAAIVFGLVALQFALAIVSFEAPVIGLLHGINAFVLAGAAGRAAALTRDPAGQPPTRTTAPA